MRVRGVSAAWWCVRERGFQRGALKARGREKGERRRSSGGRGSGDTEAAERKEVEDDPKGPRQMRTNESDNDGLGDGPRRDGVLHARVEGADVASGLFWGRLRAACSTKYLHA